MIFALVEGVEYITVRRVARMLMLVALVILRRRLVISLRSMNGVKRRFEVMSPIKSCVRTDRSATNENRATMKQNGQERRR
jgi:hypothetical protein